MLERAELVGREGVMIRLDVVLQAERDHARGVMVLTDVPRRIEVVIGEIRRTTASYGAAEANLLPQLATNRCGRSPIRP